MQRNSTNLKGGLKSPSLVFWISAVRSIVLTWNKTSAVLCCDRIHAWLFQHSKRHYIKKGEWRVGASRIALDNPSQITAQLLALHPPLNNASKPSLEGAELIAVHKRELAGMKAFPPESRDYQLLDQQNTPVAILNGLLRYPVKHIKRTSVALRTRDLMITGTSVRVHGSASRLDLGWPSGTISVEWDEGVWAEPASGFITTTDWQIYDITGPSLEELYNRSRLAYQLNKDSENVCTIYPEGKWVPSITATLSRLFKDKLLIAEWKSASLKMDWLNPEFLTALCGPLFLRKQHEVSPAS